MAGPFGMIKGHDLRDWAQRQPRCHPYLRNGGTFFGDGWRQLHCDLTLSHPPAYAFEPRIADDRVYDFMERTWMLQQLPLALALYALGGAPWVIWGGLRAGSCFSHRPLVDRLVRAQSRSAQLAYRRRRGARTQRAVQQPNHHGGIMAQQSPRLSRLREAGLAARAMGSGLVGAVRVEAPGIGMEREITARHADAGRTQTAACTLACNPARAPTIVHPVAPFF